MISINQKDKSVVVKDIIRAAISRALQEGQSFSLWKTPGTDAKHLIVCQAPQEVKEFQLEEVQKGFAFAPFLPEEKKFLFPPDIYYKFDGESFVQGPSDTMNSTSKQQPYSTKYFEILHYAGNVNLKSFTNDFTELVRQGIHEIENGHFEKLVPSRCKDISVDDFEPLDIFDTLCELHPKALVSFVSSPQTGTWLGASPEILVSVTSQNKFKTIALAGTQPYTQDVNLKSVAWTQKEIEEQALVCRYIINCFKKIRLREYEEHGPRTVVAGNVMHLKTEYEVDMVATNFPQLGSVMLKLLHPTSAVCGMPFENALEFLKSHEGYDRQFYSGYLGPVQINNESHIYVNLRCMQIFKNHIRLYAGAGVTIDSVPQKEFEETEMKMLNLQNLINQ